MKTIRECEPVAHLPPAPRRRWVPGAEVMKLLASGKVDAAFFSDVAELGTLENLTPTRLRNDPTRE